VALRHSRSSFGGRCVEIRIKPGLIVPGFVRYVKPFGSSPQLLKLELDSTIM
jgi:hypothetical protein